MTHEEYTERKSAIIWDLLEADTGIDNDGVEVFAERAIDQLVLDVIGEAPQKRVSIEVNVREKQRKIVSGDYE